MPLYGDGAATSATGSTSTTTNTAALLVLQQGKVGEIYNIGAGNEITNKELTYRLLELCGRDESFVTPVADRLGHDRRYSITHDKVSALGWKRAQPRRRARRDGRLVPQQPCLVGTVEGQGRLLMSGF